MNELQRLDMRNGNKFKGFENEVLKPYFDLWPINWLGGLGFYIMSNFINNKGHLSVVQIVKYRWLCWTYTSNWTQGSCRILVRKRLGKGSLDRWLLWNTPELWMKWGTRNRLFQVLRAGWHSQKETRLVLRTFFCSFRARVPGHSVSWDHIRAFLWTWGRQVINKENV
jgi:hypothetical protein